MTTQVLAFAASSALRIERLTTPVHRSARRVTCSAAADTPEPHNVIIVGSGPAGYTAAIYTGRAKLSPVVLEGMSSGVPGGQLMTTHSVENFPGIAEITGPQLMKNMRDQARLWGSQLLPDDCTAIDCSATPFKVHTASSGTLLANSVIIATGASARRLGVAGERDLWSRGISACAICDGAAPVFRGVPIAVVGGGDSAAEEAVYLTKYASEVHLLVRGASMRASRVLAERVQGHPNIEVHYNTHVVEALAGAASGDGSPLRAIKIDKGGQLSELKCRGMFYAIGHTPNTSFLKDSSVELTDDGLVATRIPGLPETSIPGVFVAGDVADNLWRQAVTAAGSGCQAAIAAERWLAENGLDVVSDAHAPVEGAREEHGEQEVVVVANEKSFNEGKTRHKGQYALRKLYHSSKRPLIVSYSSPGCGPCGILRPMLDAVVREFEERRLVHFVEIDITADQEIAEAAGVTGSPTVQLFHEKALVKSFIGVKQKTAYRDAIKSVLDSVPVGGK